MKWFRTRYRLVEKPVRGESKIHLQRRFFWLPFWIDIDFWTDKDYAEQKLAEYIWAKRRAQTRVVREIEDVNAFLIERKMGGQKL